jgi:hypothetical protein
MQIAARAVKHGLVLCSSDAASARCPAVRCDKPTGRG